MEIKMLHFHEGESVLTGYEEANIGCLYVRIWQRKDSKGNVGAFVITLDSDANQLDGDTVYVNQFENVGEEERIEEAHRHARHVAQEIFENYVNVNFLN